MSTGPSINRHRSKQDVETPDDFLQAVRARFGPIGFDLAADAKTSKGLHGYLGVEHDALSRDWCADAHVGTLFCNPPYGNIEPWVAKCALTAADARFVGRTLLLLAPAAVDSNWYAEHVHGRAYVMPLAPRLTFVNHKDPYPRSLMLAAYGGYVGFAPWRWRP
jgi:phage N-6-adenine-methyltransferase